MTCLFSRHPHDIADIVGNVQARINHMFYIVYYCINVDKPGGTALNSDNRCQSG